MKVWGKHISESETFQEMGSFVDGAKDGIIVFSLGSFLSVTSVPRPFQEAISAAFKKLPNYRFYRFLYILH